MQTNQEKINIAALLNGCPQGTKLYSPICGECELLKETIDIPIVVKSTKYDNKYMFDEYGQVSMPGECLLFPSKEVRDWGCFKVKYAKGGDGIKEGDKVHKLLLDNGGTEPEEGTWDCSDPLATYYIDAITDTIKRVKTVSERDYILSTGTELKLKEEQPKFKVGDVVTDLDNAHSGIIYSVFDKDDGVEYNVAYWNNKAKEIQEGILYQNELKIATPEEIHKWNEVTLHPNHLHYSKSKRKIIHWFLPFDRVIIRKNGITEWRANLFSHYDAKRVTYPYRCVGEAYDECLPYNPNTAMLIGTTNDYEQKSSHK